MVDHNLANEGRVGEHSGIHSSESSVGLNYNLVSACSAAAPALAGLKTCRRKDSLVAAHE